MTWDDLVRILSTSLSQYNMTFEHLYGMWDWTSFKEAFDMPDIHGLGRCHKISIFRNRGIYMRWKQYLTDEAWSKSILLMPPSKMQDVASWRPAPIQPSFEHASQYNAWIDKLEMFLSDGRSTIKDYKDSVQWLRDVFAHKVPIYDGPTLSTIVDGLLRLGGQSKSKPSTALVACELPCDQIAQLFPGADHANQPVNMLVELSSRGVGIKRKPPNILMPGSHIICKSTATSTVNGNNTLASSIASQIGGIASPICYRNPHSIASETPRDSVFSRFCVDCRRITDRR